MNKKIIAVIVAFSLIASIVLVASLAACNNNPTGNEETSPNQAQLPDEESASESEAGSNNGGASSSEIGDPGEYTYTDCNETVYVNNPDSAVTLRSAEYKACGSIAHGTELVRTGLSNDEGNYWSRVTYDGETYYVASKFLTDISDPDEGFVAISKTVVVNDQTGSLNIRNLPTFTGSSIIGYAIAGVEINVIAENTTTGWYKIEFTPYGSTATATGYIKSGADNFVPAEGTNESAAESSSEAAPEGVGK